MEILFYTCWVLKNVVLIWRSCFWLGLPATLNNLENIVYNKQSVIFVCLPPSCPGKHPSSIFATKKDWNFLLKGIELQVIKQVIHYQFLSLIRSMATVGSGNLLDRQLCLFRNLVFHSILRKKTFNGVLNWDWIKKRPLQLKSNSIPLGVPQHFVYK